MVLNHVVAELKSCYYHVVAEIIRNKPLYFKIFNTMTFMNRARGASIAMIFSLFKVLAHFM